MLVPFMKNNDTLDFRGYQEIDGYFANRNARFNNETLLVWNKHNQVVEFADAVDGDTFEFRPRLFGPEQTFGDKKQGFFVDSEIPFTATMEFVRMHKTSFIFHEKGTERFHLIYPSQLGQAFQKITLIRGSFEGEFKHTRKGDVWCLKVL